MYLKEDLEARSYNVTLMPFEIGSRGQITKRNRTTLADIFKTNQIKGEARKIIKRNVQSIHVMLLFNIPCKRTTNMGQPPTPLSLVVLPFTC